MGRQFIVVSALIALSIFAADTACAQNPRKNGGKFNRRGNEFRRGPGPSPFLPTVAGRAASFKKNAERWLQMDPQQRTALRERDRILRQRMKNEAEAVLRDSGLRFENGARQQFEERYLQERRRIERTLRQEIETKRQQQLPELKERLKNEFQPHQPSPATSGKPGIDPARSLPAVRLSI